MDELLNITAVEVTGAHCLRLAFEDGTVGEVDFTHEEWTGVFEPHADPDYFALVAVDPELGTISWPNGTDMAPEPLLEQARRNPCDARSMPWLSAARGRDSQSEALTREMPRLSEFYGITISMYWNEAEHRQAHFHARYAGRSASIDLAGRLIAGTLPPRALALVREWAALHRSELSDNWDRARRGQPLERIAPLR